MTYGLFGVFPVDAFCSGVGESFPCLPSSGLSWGAWSGFSSGAWVSSSPFGCSVISFSGTIVFMKLVVFVYTHSKIEHSIGLHDVQVSVSGLDREIVQTFFIHHGYGCAPASAQKQHQGHHCALVRVLHGHLSSP